MKKDNKSLLDFTYDVKSESNDISKVKCVGILADKIYDYTSFEILQFGVKNEDFFIRTINEEKYKVGSEVCIDEVSLCYDYIGIKDDETINALASYNNKNRKGEILVEANGRKVYLKGKNTSASVSKYNESNYLMLYKEFEGYFNSIIYSSDRVSVFKHGLRYFVDGLEINIKGKIGDKPFEGVKSYKKNNSNEITPIEITKLDVLGDYRYRDDKNQLCSYSESGLNLSTVNLYGDLLIPKDKKRIKLTVKLEPCLSIEDVEPILKYDGGSTISAVVKYSFLTTHNIYHSTKESLGVFIDSNGIKYRKVNMYGDK
ncbi:MAG: hypothetical protein KIC66_15420 [Clostridium sp.]|uniref:hypothetical protein n=1 Tax=Clostridium sp. TaxID=1506 RepID=UPI0025BBAF3E|nr:hypothetical protein [Clostridium sp.]MBS5928447.1 hypothetical protein [Clostridium sp.]